MAIELISTITTKNNGGYAIVLSNEIKGGIHSKTTIAGRDSITTDRLQEGMLCYVSEEKKYYQWTEEGWSDFTVANGDSDGSGGNVSGDDMGMYRVDTYEDMMNINPLNLKNGFFCHVVNDKEKNHFYYYSNGKWKSFNTRNQVWIGNTPPDDKSCLWVDTRNMVIDDDPSDITMDSYPTFIDTNLMQYMKEQIQTLHNKIKELQKIIQNGNFGGGGGNNGGGNNDDEGEIIQINGTYLVSEEGTYFITEDGDYIISEESIVEEYTPDDEGNYTGSGGNSGGEEIVLKGTYLLDENGNYILTEDGNYVITEDSIVEEYTPDDEGKNTGSGNNNNNNNSNGNNGGNIFDDDDLIIEDVIYTVKGGRITTTMENERILNIPITQATIYNESPNEINIIVNGGEIIPLSEGESLCFGDIEIESIIILEKGSTVKYIGI